MSVASIFMPNFKINLNTNKTPAHRGQVSTQQKTPGLAAVWPVVYLLLNINTFLNKSL